MFAGAGMFGALSGIIAGIMLGRSDLVAQLRGCVPALAAYRSAFNFGPMPKYAMSGATARGAARKVRRCAA